MLTWLMRVVAASLLVVAAAACGASPDHYVSVLDELPVPSDWQLVYLTISAPGGPDVSSDPGTPRKRTDCILLGECPSVARYYMSRGQLPDLFATARQVLVDASYDVDGEYREGCDRPGRGLVCEVDGVRGGDRVRITIYDTGSDPTASGLADPSRSIIRVLAEGAK